MNFPINYDGMCRTCLRKSENLADIFVVGKSNVTLSSAIMECAPVHILPGDGMPTQICSDCIDKLQVAHRFREMCLQADRTLRQYLSAISASTAPPPPPPPITHHHPKRPTYPEMPVKVELITPAEAQVPTATVVPPHYNLVGTIVQQVTQHQQQQQRGNPQPDIEPEVKLETLKNVNFRTPTNGGGGGGGGESNVGNGGDVVAKRFSCDVCEKSFPVNNALIKHYRIHSGERPYKCNICGKDFNCSSTLSVHIRFHNNDRRFKCTLCDKSYVVKSHLTVHMRAHTGEHPYSCHVCDKRFRISKSLTRHLKNNTCDRVVNEFTLQKYGVTM